MRIGFDGTPLLGQRSGVGNYTANLLAAILQENPDWEFLLYSNREFDALEESLSDLYPVYSPISTRRMLWMHFLLPGIIRKTQPRLCHFPNAMAPISLSKPFILTIHDASLFLHRHFHPMARLLSIRLTLPYLAHRASAIITVSNHARDDLIRIMNLKPEKVFVTHEAASEQFRPVTDNETLEHLRHKYHLPESYILYVGTLESRKNLVRLVRAFSELHKKGFSHQLVVVGATGWKASNIFREIEDLSLEDKIIMPGYIPKPDLPGILSMSELFVFPSLFEGFGLPPLEAMSCGTPVIASNRSSMPEICGDAAHYIDPEDEQSIIAGMAEILGDKEYHQEMRRRGLERARQFSWRKTARETSEIYRWVLNNDQ